MPSPPSANVVWVLFVGRIIDGLTGSTFGVAQASVIDVAEPRDRPRLLGLLGAAFGLGFVAGPIIGGLGGDRWPPVAVRRRGSGLGRERDRGDHSRARDRGPHSDADANRTIVAAASRRDAPRRRIRVWPAWRCLGLLGDDRVQRFRVDVLAPARSALRCLARRRLRAVHGDRLGDGRHASACGRAGQPTRRRQRDPCILRWLRAASVTCCWPSTGGGYRSALALAFLVVGQGLFTPTLSSVIAGAVDPASRGEAFGVQQSASALGRIAGPVLAGLLFEHVGRGVALHRRRGSGRWWRGPAFPAVSRQSSTGSLVTDR